MRRKVLTIEARCALCGGPLTADRPAIYQKRAGRRWGVWVPVLAEWRPWPGQLVHPRCYVRRYGTSALYVALARNLLAPLNRLGGGPATPGTD